MTFILAFITAGCSSGGKTPILPGEPGEMPAPSIYLPDDIQSYPRANASDSSEVGVFLMYSLELNRDELTAELVPIRNASALGDTYQSDITGFLYSLCVDCLQVVGVGLTENDEFLEVTFRLHHPIPIPGNLSDPQHGERIDLHLFDVHGIIFADGSRIYSQLKSDVNGDGNPDETIRCRPDLVVNADGYTTFFDEYMDNNIYSTSANLHAYRMFFEDARQGNYREDIAPVNGWITLIAPQGQNVFPQGGRTDDVNYIFNIEPGGNLELIMAFDACYGHSTKFEIPFPDVGCRTNPRYFLPEFHRKEAWKAFVDITNNTLAHGGPDTHATLSVTVYDWQAGLAGNGAIDYFNGSLTDISSASDVTGVEIYFPELLENPLVEPESVIGTGVWTDPYVYTFTLDNELDPEGGTYFGIAAIRDSLVGGGNGPVGTTRDLGIININDFTNYQIFQVEVAAYPPNIPPEAFFETDPRLPEITSGESITFDATNSSDPDGEITIYEWDFEFEGEFVPDETGATPPPHRYDNPNPSRPENYFAVLRVLDNGDPPLEGIFGMEILVQPNSPPIAVFTVDPPSPFSECALITLNGEDSYDSDGEVVAYEWDFEYDPQSPDFTVEATGCVIQRRFSHGSHNVMLRVKDDSSPPLEGVTRLKLVSEPLSGLPGEVAFCENYILNEEDSYNSHSFMGGGQKSAVLLATGAVAVAWVDEGNVAGGPAIKYSVSIDGGRSFNPPLTANSNLISASPADLRPTMIADFMGNLHLAYADGNSYYYHITDHQGVFGAPVEVGTGENDYGGPTLAIDIEGTINYFFTGTISGGNVPLRLARSTDGGSTFDSPLTIVNDGKFPSAATAQFGPVVLAFEGKNNSISDNSDIMVCYQRSGSQFYPPVRIVDSTANDGISTHPSVAVGMNSAVYVAWQDSRDGDTINDFDIFYSYSFTGLTFIPNRKVNDSVESPGNQILQDNPSIGIDMMGRTFIAWRDFRDGSGGDVYFSFALMPDRPTFVENVKINSDSSPENVTQGPPVILISSNSGIMLVWGDERNASSDLGTPFSGESDIYYTFGKLF
jgi:hypothetical protein